MQRNHAGEFSTCRLELRRSTLLVGGGFLLGTAGIKLLTSAPVKNACVQGIACGMRVKNCYQDMVEQAKANVDDMVASPFCRTSAAWCLSTRVL